MGCLGFNLDCVTVGDIGNEEGSPTRKTRLRYLYHGFDTPGESFRSEGNRKDVGYDQPRTSSNLEDEIAGMNLFDLKDEVGETSYRRGDHKRQSSRYSPLGGSDVNSEIMNPEWAKKIPSDWYEGMDTNLGPIRRPSQDGRRDDNLMANEELSEELKGARETLSTRSKSSRHEHFDQLPDLHSIKFSSGHKYKPPGFQQMQIGLWSGAVVRGQPVTIEEERPSTSGRFTGAEQLDVERHGRHLAQAEAHHWRQGRATRLPRPPGLPRPPSLAKKNKQVQAYPDAHHWS